MIADIDFAVVRRNNGFADRKADAHAFVGIGFRTANIGGAVKNGMQTVLCDADAEIFDMEGDRSKHINTATED